MGIVNINKYLRENTVKDKSYLLYYVLQPQVNPHSKLKIFIILEKKYLLRSKLFTGNTGEIPSTTYRMKKPNQPSLAH